MDIRRPTFERSRNGMGARPDQHHSVPNRQVPDSGKQPRNVCDRRTLCPGESEFTVDLTDNRSDHHSATQFEDDTPRSPGSTSRPRRRDRRRNEDDVVRHSPCGVEQSPPAWGTPVRGMTEIEDVCIDDSAPVHRTGDQPGQLQDGGDNPTIYVDIIVVDVIDRIFTGRTGTRRRFASEVCTATEFALTRDDPDIGCTPM
ncbi:hypothetical protein N806_21300 [Rhodococcus sp. P27]|nr:hypothetical protein N806_21300 [Rhodococcus sp. P27]